MKGKKALNTLMIVTLIISLTMVASNLVPIASADPWWGQIYIDPAKVSDYTKADLTCTYFNVTLKITNVTNMCGWGSAIWYNSTIIRAEACNVVVPGAANLAPIWPNGTWKPINNSVAPGVGRILFGFTVALPGVTQPGVLDIATIKFHRVLAPPLDTYTVPTNKTVSCPLHLNMTSVVDNAAVEQEANYQKVDGFYEYIREQNVAGSPTAKFTWSPTYPFVGDTVTCDGSTSETGDSTITSWDWTLTGPGFWTTGNGASTRQFQCNGTGTVSVTLNITNTLGLSDDVTHDIIQSEKIGPAIDLYTQNWRQYPEWTYTPYNGSGVFEDCDSYAPGENVSLWAYVTYNDELVQNILVGFEVLDPLNRCVTYRVDRTDEVGIAQVWFRIPIPCSDEDLAALFGHWTVIAKCKLQDDIINDTMRFKVGWIIEITELIALQDPLIKNETACFNVTLKNIAWVPRNVTIIVVVYDECDVPIGQYIIHDFNMTEAEAVLCSSMNVTKTLCIPVPKWAYVGIGSVYATAWTHLPQDCGVPYCPEVPIEEIEIKPAGWAP